jgi:hypothetical protein
MCSVDRSLARPISAAPIFWRSDQRFMPPKSKPVQDDREQARAFIAAAHKVGKDGSLGDFEEALTRENKKKAPAGRKKP